MNPAKRKRLERAGFRVASAQEFVGLTEPEAALIDLKIRLIQMVTTMRVSAGVTQLQLAKAMNSSQSRVAKIESASPDITLDLICKALFALGVSRQILGKMIASRRAA